MMMNLLHGLLHLLLVWISAQSLLFILRNHSRTRARNLPPGPSFMTAIRNLLYLSCRPHKCLAQLANIYGPAMTIQLGYVTTVVVWSVSMAKEVLLRNDASCSYRNPLISFSVLGHNEATVAFLPPNSYWRNLRKICKSQIFAGSKLDATRGLRRKVVQQLLSHVQGCCEAGVPVKIGEAVFTTSLNYLSNAFFSMDSADPCADTARELRKLVWGVAEVVGKPNFADYFPQVKFLDLQGIERRTTKLVGQAIRIIDAMITRRLQSREEVGYVEDDDVLGVLLNISQDNSGELKRSHIPHLLLELLVGGTDTTTATVEWAVAELLHRPEKLKKAQIELEEAVGKANPIEEDDIARLPYLQAIVKETFRMHPPVPFLVPRKVIVDVELSGFMVPKNTQVLVNIWAIGRDESL
ncbi:hypothetical protein Nepgr_018978 [Nepenthes gracilis]|uniref:Cytochrome P450 n=1 Tax=Nepenthes gracilis TaxID=150966 RepID=A0AAD3SU66_NEPGR|nr:hypothetical protein Nepgr_018978 [Nepenthes gracilis]